MFFKSGPSFYNEGPFYVPSYLIRL